MRKTVNEQLRELLGRAPEPAEVVFAYSYGTSQLLRKLEEGGTGAVRATLDSTKGDTDG